jgi:hypothetical protein
MPMHASLSPSRAVRDSRVTFAAAVAPARRCPFATAWAALALLAGCADGGDAGPRLARASSALDPLRLGTEQLVGTPEWGRAEQPQYGVAMARSSSSLLAVYADESRYEGGDVWSARLSPTGEVLDVPAKPVALTAGTQATPRVASDGTDFLVVWTEWNAAQLSIYGARMNAAGELLDAAGGFPIAAGQAGCDMADVAFDGQNYLVVWQDSRGGDLDVYGARVSPAGPVLDPAGLRLCDEPGDQGFPRVVADGGQSLVVYQDFSAGGPEPRLQAVRLGANAQPLDTVPIDVAPAVRGGVPAAVAAGAGIYAVGYQAAEPDGGDLLLGRLSQAGVLLDDPPLAVAAEAAQQGSPAAAFDGTDFLLAWHHQSTGTDFDIRARRVGSNGTLGPSTIVIAAKPEQEARPAVAVADGSAIVAWDDLTAGSDMDLFAARWQTDDSVSAPVLLSAGAHPQHYPALGSLAQGALLSWTDGAARPDWRVLGLPLDANGVPSAAEPVALGAKSGEVHSASTGPTGDPPLVAWLRYSDATSLDVLGARLGPTGAPWDDTPIAIAVLDGVQMDVALAWGETESLAVYADERPSLPDANIYATRVTTEGVVLDPEGFAVSTSDWYEYDPSVAYGRGVYLVAWECIPDYDKVEKAHVRFSLVTGPGQQTEPVKLGSPNVDRDAVQPLVAFDGEQFLIVWEFHDPTGWNIYASRVTTDGTVLDPEGVAVSNTDYASTGRLMIEPAVVFDGTSYTVAWQDEFLSRIELARVGTDGTVLDPEPAVLADAAGIKLPALGLRAPARVTLAYERFVPELSAWRVASRSLLPEGSGGGGGAAGSGGAGGAAPSTDGARLLEASGGCACAHALGAPGPPRPWHALLWLAAAGASVPRLRRRAHGGCGATGLASCPAPARGVRSGRTSIPSHTTCVTGAGAACTGNGSNRSAADLHGTAHPMLRRPGLRPNCPVGPTVGCYHVRPCDRRSHVPPSGRPACSRPSSPSSRDARRASPPSVASP